MIYLVFHEHRLRFDQNAFTIDAYHSLLPERVSAGFAITEEHPTWGEFEEEDRMSINICNCLFRGSMVGDAVCCTVQSAIALNYETVNLSVSYSRFVNLASNKGSAIFVSVFEMNVKF